ncbi:DNA (cytosine-5-)-methyltransferase [Oribacterium sp. oral taxon 078 str. F0263]|uniref:site-specific DNA-methyltransferase n=1 Tax=Oribacterium sp. oral taxon 078 TaxID=652706 RepID=UPI0003ADC71F|nr:site-specific DNA-methyltransferase [Oribacterium sp. oral taxon 078]ERL22621.1 DNA (cytosine-5-)-methyltransferase [Oribacterium sp. oral taxon 078 str. F0263]
MDKLKMHSLDGVERNIEQIGRLFPNAVTEVMRDGRVEHAIDFDVLRQELSDSIVEGREERYQFTWPDKKEAVLATNAPITATLRPIPEDSVGKDGTHGGFDSENLYIEGDNLKVLKLLQETYLGKVKMIYIDPPYNTGNDFVYEDDFSRNTADYMKGSGQYDEVGNRMVTNTENNGRFHTDWLNMIYPRLRLAKDLLSDDGVVFISIDDNEQENLKKCCDEIFGAKNFIAQLIWERAYAPKNDARFISNSHDYVLMFARNINNFIIGRLPRTAEANARYQNPDNDPRGVWKPSDLSVKTYNAACDYLITAPSGRIIEPPAGRCWSLSKKAFLERLQDNRIYFGADGNSVPCMKRFLTELKFDGMAPTSLLFYKDVGHSQEGAKEVTALMEAGVFDGPKPVRLLMRLLTLANLSKDSIVLDFFSGSGTTAHALMRYNVEREKRCRFIVVQALEATEEAGIAYKAGYRNICEIGKERIRRAGKKIKEEAGLAVPADLDIGFRCLRLDESNMDDVYYAPEELRQETLFSLVDNVKPDRSPEDLLFQVMLDLGIFLSSPIERKEISGKKVFDVADGFLLACFDRDIRDETVKAIAKRKPYYAVFRDSGMANDSVAANFDQIFETYSPDTVRKVL